jgi:hypothetical protein
MISPSTSDSVAFSAGQDAADVLLHASPSLKRAEAMERQHLRNELRKVDTAVLKLDLRCSLVQRKLEHAESRYDARNARLEGLEGEYGDHPASFAWFRGLIYILMAFLILVADFAFLTQVLGAVFELNMQMPVPDTDPQQYVGPIGALAPQHWSIGLPYFAEIYATTIGVLLLAMSFKAWGDRKRSTPLPAGATVYQRLWWVLSRAPQYSVLFLTAIALLAISYARVAVEYGNFEGADQAQKEMMAVGRAVSAIVGLACPVVGVFLFMRGMDAISKRMELAIVRTTTRRLERKRDRLQTAWRQKFEVLQSKRREREDLVSPEAWQERLAKLSDQFRLGYAAGVRDQLHGPEKSGVYRQLRARLLIPDPNP